MVHFSLPNAYAGWFFKSQKQRMAYQTMNDRELAQERLYRYEQLRRLADYKVDSRYKSYALDMKNFTRKASVTKLKLKISNAYLTISPLAAKAQDTYMHLLKDERKDLVQYWKKSVGYMKEMSKYNQLTPFANFHDLEMFLDHHNIAYNPRDMAKTVHNVVHVFH